jgi:hypothetical protein
MESINPDRSGKNQPGRSEDHLCIHHKLVHDRHFRAPCRKAIHVKIFEHWLTRRFLLTISILLLVSWGIFALVVLKGTTVEVAAKVVDAIFKIAAVVVGGAWTLNRYFTARTDELQLCVDAVVDFVSPDSEGDGMFICRLDVVNTGKALTPAFGEFIAIESATVDHNDVVYKPLMRWPDRGFHPSGPIEPGSWSALSFAIPLMRSTKVVRIYLELHFEGGKAWNWHRHFVGGRASNESAR